MYDSVASSAAVLIFQGAMHTHGHIKLFTQLVHVTKAMCISMQHVEGLGACPQEF